MSAYDIKQKNMSAYDILMSKVEHGLDKNILPNYVTSTQPPGNSLFTAESDTLDNDKILPVSSQDDVECGNVKTHIYIILSLGAFSLILIWIMIMLQMQIYMKKSGKKPESDVWIDVKRDAENPGDVDGNLSRNNCGKAMTYRSEEDENRVFEACETAKT
jgi:hypothetical protein